MKKLTFLATLFIASFTFSQGTLKEGKTQLNLGVGFSGWGTPVFLGLDYGLGNNWTVGGEVSYRSFGNDAFFYDYTYTIIGVAGNGNYHFNEILDLPKKWDLYGGASLGFYIWNNSYKYKGTGAEPVGFSPGYTGTSGIGFGLQAGTRYFFNDNWAINFETGGGSTFGGKIGLTYKFGGSSSRSSSSSKGSSSNSSSTKSVAKTETKVEPKTEAKPATKTEAKPKTTSKKKKK